MKKSILFAFIVLSASLARADDEAAARAVLDAAIKAHGGEAVLSKFVGLSCKISANTLIGDKKIPRTDEYYAQGLDKYRETHFEGTDKSPTSIIVLDGRKGWYKHPGDDAIDLPDQTVNAERDDLFLTWATTLLVPLKAKNVHLSTVKSETVDERKLDGILVKSEKRKPLKLYFDAETHLLVIVERNTKTEDGQTDVVERDIGFDFKDVQGTKQPFKTKTLWDGVEIGNGRCTGMKLYDKPLDKKLFEKP